MVDTRIAEKSLSYDVNKNSQKMILKKHMKEFFIKQTWKHKILPPLIVLQNITFSARTFLISSINFTLIFVLMNICWVGTKL